jgi:hypothetical protein
MHELFCGQPLFPLPLKDFRPSPKKPKRERRGILDSGKVLCERLKFLCAAMAKV